MPLRTISTCLWKILDQNTLIFNFPPLSHLPPSWLRYAGFSLLPSLLQHIVAPSPPLLRSLQCRPLPSLCSLSIGPRRPRTRLRGPGGATIGASRGCARWARRPCSAGAVAAGAGSELVVVVVVDAEETEEERTRRDEAAELMRIASVKRVLHSKSSGGPCSTCAHTPPSPSPRNGTPRSYPSTCSGRLRRATSGDRRSSKRAGDRSARFSFLSARAGMSVWLGSSGRWPMLASSQAR